jgi:superfamily I DNA/RNA helicase
MAKRSFYIRDSELDEYQIKVVNRKIDNSFIVRGCAGSGKSILALWKVKQIQEKKLGSFYFVVYTKALKQYMKDGITQIGLDNEKILHHYAWEKLTDRTADYIIVDEAQDFSESQILDFKRAAKKVLILYGDSNQQVYGFKSDPPISMEDIMYLTKMPDEKLVYNHRLPKKIARIAEVVGEVDDLEFVCRDEGSEKPKVLQCQNYQDQLDLIKRIIETRNFEDVGIFFPDNKMVKSAYKYFESIGFNVEAKYDVNFSNNDNLNTISFNSETPKMLTYHSSKGLQFEAVFIPSCSIDDDTKRSALYVAITRCYRALFILHVAALSPFFEQVKESDYETSLSQGKGRRL